MTTTTSLMIMTAPVRYAVHLYSESSGILMDLSTDYPGIQMYTANYLEDAHGKNSAVYHPRDAVCFEPQFFPDAIHKPAFQVRSVRQAHCFTRRLSTLSPLTDNPVRRYGR